MSWPKTDSMKSAENRYKPIIPQQIAKLRITKGSNTPESSAGLSPLWSVIQLLIRLLLIGHMDALVAHREASVNSKGHRLTAKRRVIRQSALGMDMQMWLGAVTGIAKLSQHITDFDVLPFTDLDTALSEVGHDQIEFAAFDGDIIAGHLLAIHCRNRVVSNAVYDPCYPPRTGCQQGCAKADILLWILRLQATHIQAQCCNSENIQCPALATKIPKALDIRIQGLQVDVDSVRRATMGNEIIARGQGCGDIHDLPFSAEKPRKVPRAPSANSNTSAALCTVPAAHNTEVSGRPPSSCQTTMKHSSIQ